MKTLMIAVVGCALVSGSFGAGFQASLTPDIAVENRDTDINGVSIGVWNENPSEKFQWQIGFVNGATGNSVGLQGPFIALYNYSEDYKGVKIGLVNYTAGDFVGWQAAVVNFNDGSLIGLQGPSAFNYNTKMTGVQFGFVNYTESVENWAVQIGIANIINENGWFDNFPSDLAKGMVLVNWSFK